ncbi:MAG: cytochrome c maturation protein CcmE [Anaerolineales bacterium]|nr:cytochrome c maturation protein CcmE [Anaerolineales bacterium]
MAIFSRFPWKFVAGTLIILAALILLVVPALQMGTQYYLTVDEVLAEPDRYQEEVVRISGAVIGGSILWDGNTGVLVFSIANVPAALDQIEADGGFQASLHAAVNDPNRTRLNVRYEGAPPDLLQDEVQAILTGRLNASGIFMADEILLKCPSRYQDESP